MHRDRSSNSKLTASLPVSSQLMVQKGGEVVAATTQAQSKPQRRRWQPFKRLLLGRGRKKDKQQQKNLKQQQRTQGNSHRGGGGHLDLSKTGDDDDYDDDGSWNSSPTSSPSQQQRQEQQQYRQELSAAPHQKMTRRQSNPNPRKQHARRPNSPMGGDTTSVIMNASTKSFADFEVEASNSIMMRHNGYQTTNTTTSTISSRRSDGGPGRSVAQAWVNSNRESSKMKSILKGKGSNSYNDMYRRPTDSPASATSASSHPSPLHVTQLVLRDGPLGTGVNNKNDLEVVTMAMADQAASSSYPETNAEVAAAATVEVADVVNASQQQIDSSALEHQYSSSRLLVLDEDEQQEKLSAMLNKQTHRSFLLADQGNDSVQHQDMTLQDQNGPLDVDTFIPKNKAFPAPTKETIKQGQPLGSSQKTESPKMTKSKMVMIPVRNNPNQEVLAGDSDKAADLKEPKSISTVATNTPIAGAEKRRRELGLQQSSSPQIYSKTTTTKNDRRIQSTPSRATATTTTQVSPPSPTLKPTEAAATKLAVSRPTRDGSVGLSPLETKTTSAPVTPKKPGHASEVESMEDAPADEHVECIKEEHARVPSMSHHDFVEAIMAGGASDLAAKRNEPNLLDHDEDDDDDDENASEYPTTESGGNLRIHCIEVSSSGGEIEVAELPHFYDDRLGRLVELSEGNHRITETIHAEEVSLDASVSRNSEQSDADPFKSLEEEEARRPPAVITGPPMVSAKRAGPTTSPLRTPKSSSMVGQESPKSIQKASTNLVSPATLASNQSNKWQKNKSSKSNSKTWPSPASPNLGVEVNIETSQQAAPPITPQPSDEEQSRLNVAPKSVKQSRRTLLKNKQEKVTAAKQAKGGSAGLKEAAHAKTVGRVGSKEQAAFQATLLTSQQQEQHPARLFISADGGDPNRASSTSSCSSDLVGPDAEDLELTRETSDLSGSMGVDSCHLEIQSERPEHETELVLDEGGAVATVAPVDFDINYIDDRDERIERVYSEESSNDDDSSQEADDSAYTDSEYGESDYTSMTGDSYTTETPRYATNSLLMRGIRLAETIVGGPLHRKSFSETEEEDEDEEEDYDYDEEEGEEAALLISESESVTSHGSLHDESTNRSSYSFSSQSSDGSQTGTACSSRR